jgi:8-amino-7-oxononanoate synthase
MLNPYLHYCLTQQQQGRYRELYKALPTLPCSSLDFSSNDYLALAQSEALYRAASQAGYQYGVGTGGSRLLAGNPPLFAELESRIAKDKGTEAALIMQSGFQANSSVLASLLHSPVLGAKPLVFFDKLNHASLYQALFLSKAEMIRYRHNDMQHLQDLLTKHQQSTRPKFIVTETLFGMDGDIVPLSDLVQLARQYHTFLYLDEAHATGIIGAGGYGLANSSNIEDVPHVIMGTFSKALGCFGAYIACPEQIKNYLINACPGFIYATSLSPMVIGAVNKAWDMVPSLTQERALLFSHATLLRNRLNQAGFDTATSSTHIIPLILGDEKTVMHAKTVLYQSGIMLSAIRPPTVPPKTSRLRIALNIRHHLHDLNRLLEALKQL